LNLENERGRPFEPRQDRDYGIKQCPISEIAMRSRHDHGALRVCHGKGSKQTAIVFQLPEQPPRGYLGCSIEKDDVKRRICRIAFCSGSSFGRDVFEAELGEDSICV